MPILITKEQKSSSYGIHARLEIIRDLKSNSLHLSVNRLSINRTDRG